MPGHEDDEDDFWPNISSGTHHPNRLSLYLRLRPYYYDCTLVRRVSNYRLRHHKGTFTRASRSAAINTRISRLQYVRVYFRQRLRPVSGDNSPTRGAFPVRIRRGLRMTHAIIPRPKIVRVTSLSYAEGIRSIRYVAKRL